MTGRVLRIHPRGFFIIRNDVGAVIFAHFSKLHGGRTAFNALKPGSWCTFDVAMGPTGKQEAVNVWAASSHLAEIEEPA